MKKTVLSAAVLMFVLLFSSVLFSQEDQQYNYPSQLEYTDALVQTMEGAQFLCSTLTILPDSNMVQYFDLNTNEIKKSSLREIDQIKIVSGNKAAMQGLMGALGGFSTFALIFQLAGGENTEMSESTLNGLCAGCTGCGLVSGIIVGSEEKTYKPIYQNGDFIN